MIRTTPVCVSGQVAQPWSRLRSSQLQAEACIHLGAVEQGDDPIHIQQGPHSEAFEIAPLIDLFLAHQLLISGRNGTESGHNHSTRALG